MESKRPYFRTKAAWAAARAAAARQDADAIDRVPSADWRGVQRRASAQARLRAEARKFEQLEARFRATGQ
jgi:hypothetical protein